MARLLTSAATLVGGVRLHAPSDKAAIAAANNSSSLFMRKSNCSVITHRSLTVAVQPAIVRERSPGLKIQLQRQLHLPRRIRLIPRGIAEYSERLRLQAQGTHSKTDPVECVEQLATEVHADLLPDREGLREREVFVEREPRTEVRVVP